MPMQHGRQPMTAEHRREMVRGYHVRTLWIPLMLLVVGVWLATAPFTFGYLGSGSAGPRVAEVTRLRGLANVGTRGLWMATNDLVAGLLLISFALLSLRPGAIWPRWAAAGVGAWLVFAPLFLWAPTSAAFLNDTLVGILVVALTILIPMMPGMMLIMQPGPEVPPGWSYNPSAWLQRAPLIALSWTSFFFARYLAAYQLGYLDAAVDPFFGDGTMWVLDSSVSLAFPISDAGLGAAAITIEALMGYMGGTSRWRTMPWMVTFFGILVIPLGVAHVTLVILQPVVVGSWCTFCLAAAIPMLIMIPLALDEVVAMVQFIRERLRRGDAFWSVFFKGGTLDADGGDERTPGYPGSPGRLAAAAAWGVTVPWTLAVGALAGVWLMISPDVLGATGSVADANRIVGATAVVVAVVATAELARGLRFLNVVVGAAALVVPMLLGDAPAGLWWTNVGVAAVLVASTLPRGAIRQSYGSADRFVR